MKRCQIGLRVWDSYVPATAWALDVPGLSAYRDGQGKKMPWRLVHNPSGIVIERGYKREDIVSMADALKGLDWTQRELDTDDIAAAYYTLRDWWGKYLRAKAAA